MNVSWGHEMQEEPSNLVSLHRAVSLEFIKQSGGYAVKALKGQKEPAKGWDPKLNNYARSETLLEELRYTDDNVGIHLHSNLLDVDIDSDVPFLMPALEALLPSCSHVWGRKSRPRTHRVYMLKTDENFDPAAHPVLRRIKKIEEAQVEMRGGPQTRGEYSILPGSIHPSGEMYEWADIGKARSTPSVSTASTIMRAIRMAGALAVIAPHWQEGSRNEMVMALSGFLYRIHSIAENFGGEIFHLNRETSLQFIQTLLDITDDDRSDRVARIKTFNQTWDKGEKGANVTGLTRIVEITGDKFIMQKLYVLLADSPDIVLVDEFLARFAIWQGPGLVVDMEAASKGAMRPFMTRQAFVNSFGHKFIMVDEKRRLIADMIFYMESATRVTGVTFEPGKEQLVDTREGRKVNQWSGFAIQPYKDPVSEDEVKPFLDYIMEIIAVGDMKIYKWVLAWVAHLFKEPGNKCKTALVLTGKPGAGKSILGHTFISPIIGEHHAITTNSVEAIARGFNVQFDNKIFVQADEATNSKQRVLAAKMKSLITDPTIIVEPKGVDPFAKPNHMRFLFTSNYFEDAVHLDDGADDRRYMIVEVSPHRKDQIDTYWAPLIKWANQNHDKIHRYLIDYKYDPAIISRPINTQAKVYMQQASMEPFDAWISAWAARQHPLSDEAHMNWHDAPVNKRKDIVRSGWPKLISYSALCRDFFLFSGRKILLNESRMSVNLEKRGLAGKLVQKIKVMEIDRKLDKRVERRVRLYELPPYADIATYLKVKYGVEIVNEDDGTSEDEGWTNTPQSDAIESEF